MDVVDLTLSIPETPDPTIEATPSASPVAPPTDFQALSRRVPLPPPPPGPAHDHWTRRSHATTLHVSRIIPYFPQYYCSLLCRSGPPPPAPRGHSRGHGG